MNGKNGEKSKIQAEEAGKVIAFSRWLLSAEGAEGARPIAADAVKRAEQCLVDNGIEPDEAPTVLQAIGYILMGTELYPA